MSNSGGKKGLITWAFNELLGFASAGSAAGHELDFSPERLKSVEEKITKSLQELNKVRKDIFDLELHNLELNRRLDLYASKQRNRSASDTSASISSEDTGFNDQDRLNSVRAEQERQATATLAQEQEQATEFRQEIERNAERIKTLEGIITQKERNINSAIAEHPRVQLMQKFSKMFGYNNIDLLNGYIEELKKAYSDSPPGVKPGSFSNEAALIKQAKGQICIMGLCDEWHLQMSGDAEVKKEILNAMIKNWSGELAGIYQRGFYSDSIQMRNSDVAPPFTNILAMVMTAIETGALYSDSVTQAKNRYTQAKAKGSRNDSQTVQQGSLLLKVANEELKFRMTPASPTPSPPRDRAP